jgi:hypothetical protein
VSRYNFELLSSDDFELLVRDLLQEELSIRLESFARGRDGGIDFRFKQPNGDLVVQCKHYATYPSLHSVLTRDELPKVQRLQPRRYILVVSTELTPSRKDQLVDMFSPYCQSAADVYGREDINNLLGRYPLVEQKHFKLWLTSTPVLERILHSGIYGDSESTLERIKERVRVYVPNASFRRALKILDTRHSCIIAGIPGIGKTTLAEILLMEFAERRGFQALCISNDLSEIRPVKDPKRRQIFYFDDFLGTTALDELERNEDRRLIEMLEEVAKNPNWRFVLTTREYVLNAAMNRHEILGRSPVDISPCIVGLADYTIPIRARILYNHVYFSDISREHKLELLVQERYRKIVEHPNYNPRIVERMTQPVYANTIPASSYFETFLEHLRNPVQIWDHAFRNRISPAAQHLLMVMATVPGEVRLADLRSAFDSFHRSQQIALNRPLDRFDFDRSLKELDGNFVRTNLIGSEKIINFHNPSVQDYMESYLATQPGIVVGLIESSVFFDQLTRMWKGQRGVRYIGIDENRDQFEKRLLDAFAHPMCELRRLMSDGVVDRVRVVDRTPEAWAIFALEVAKTPGKHESKSFVDAALQKLIDNTSITSDRKRGFLTVLKTVAADALIGGRKHPIFLSSQQRLMGDLESLDDFDCASIFIEHYPELVSPPVIQRCAEQFQEFCAFFEIDSDEPDELVRQADQFEAVAGILDADVGKLPDQLRERATEIETEWESQESDADDYRDDDERGPAPDDYGEMFERLEDEVSENGD